MKKFIALILSAILVCTVFVGCGADNVSGNSKAAAKSDLEYIKDKGKLVVGITEFEPMDYKDANGKWIGFDADMANEFAKSIGVEAEFVIVDWDNKTMELDGKTIDCVWNGMTLVDEVTSAMECSNPYFNNAQVVIVPSKNASKYKTVEDCKDLNFAVENGSAGQKAVEALGYKFTAVADQATALTEVKSGTCDAAVIDMLMAVATVGEGTDYADLIYTANISGAEGEQYGVGFRKGSDVVKVLNEFFVENYENGNMTKIAEKYKIQDYIIEQK